GQAQDGQGQEMRLPRAGWAPDQAEALVEGSLESRKLALRHAVLSSKVQGTAPDGRGHGEWAGRLVRPFDQTGERRIILTVEIRQMGQDFLGVEIGKPLLHEVMCSRP